MNDGEYALERIFTPQRILAGLLFTAWIVIAYRLGGLPLSVLRFTGWTVILGMPVAWLLLSRL